MPKVEVTSRSRKSLSKLVSAIRLRNLSEMAEDQQQQMLQQQLQQQMQQQMQQMQPQQGEMVNPIPPTPLTSKELGMYLTIIPDYKAGDSLPIFLTQCDKLVEQINGRLSEDLFFIFNNAILNKIKGEAREYLAHENSETYPDIRRTLISRFGDSKSEELHLFNLIHSVQLSKETYLEFYSRILKGYTALAQNLTINYPDPNYQLYKKTDYANTALKAFKNGLLEPYRTYLSHFTLNNLEDCLNKCKSLENQNQEFQYCDSLRKQTDTSKTNKPEPTKFITTYQPTFTRQQFLPRQNWFQPNQRSNPSQVRQNWNGQQTKNWANQGTQQNPQQPNKFLAIKDEPMSTQSRVRTNQYQYKNQNQPNQIHNVEGVCEQECEYQEPCEYQEQPYGCQEQYEGQQYGYQDPGQATNVQQDFPKIASTIHPK